MTPKMPFFGTWPHSDNAVSRDLAYRPRVHCSLVPLFEPEFSQNHARFLHNVRVSVPQNKPQLVRWTEPPPMEAGAPLPAVHSDGHNLLCAYIVDSTVAPVRSVAILKFEVVLQFRFGYPNAEALPGHPLYQFGLGYYDFFTVENSPLIIEIEKQNECHSRHRPGIYAKFHHWIVTFHDKTLEVLALRAKVSGQTDLTPEEAVCMHEANRSRS